MDVQGGVSNTNLLSEFVYVFFISPEPLIDDANQDFSAC